MGIESTAYTRADLQNFFDDLLDHERMALAERLESASARLARIGPRIKAGRGEGEWSDHEVLAHIAGLSKYYGVVIHRISSGQVTDIDLLAGTNLRDSAIDQMALIEPAELLKMTLADHARTIKLLRSIDAASLRREAKDDNFGSVTPELLARLPLINHLEQHVDQLERSLGG